MARYASGKHAYGISDRSGFRYRLADMITEWNGLKVGPDEYEPKHPQLEPISPGSDPQALFEPRPDTSTEVAGQRLLIKNPFQSGLSMLIRTQSPSPEVKQQQSVTHEAAVTMRPLGRGLPLQQQHRPLMRQMLHSIRQLKLLTRVKWQSKQ